MTISCTSRTRGVALLEVLVSVTILSVGLTAAMSGLRTGIRSQRLAEERALALRLAERQWAILRIGGIQALDRTMEGRFEDPYDGFTWAVESEPPAEDQPFAPVRLTIREGSGDHLRTLLSMRALLR